MVKGYPDWATNVIQKEGTAFVVTGNVDANITNAEIDAHVTNSKISIEPAEGSEFVIKPAQSVVFNVQGSVDANITNSKLNVDANITNSKLNVDANITNSTLDVNVTNSSLNVSVQGTADVEIQNAQLNVATLRELAPSAGKVLFAADALDLGNASTTPGVRLYENNTGHDVYLEQIIIAMRPQTTSPPSIQPYEHAFIIEVIRGTDTVLLLCANYIHSPLNFDPAIPIHDGEHLSVFVYGPDKPDMQAVISAILREP